MSERDPQSDATRGRAAAEQHQGAASAGAPGLSGRKAVSAQRRRRDRVMLVIGAALGLAVFALLVAL